MADYQQMDVPQFPKGGLRVILGVFIGLVVLVGLWKSFKTVNGGEGGVLFRLSNGVDTETTYAEGIHLIAPWNNLIVYEVRQQQVMETMAVLSSNGLEISLDISAWFQPSYDHLPLLYKEKGQNYIDQVVKPALRSATRSVIGRYTPEEIYSSKRDAIQLEIFDETKIILDKQFVQLNEILVRDITLPPTIKKAIESKLQQEQQSLEYEFKLQKAHKEAEKVKIEAEGKAAANKILNASLTPNILKEKGIEATLKLSESPNTKVVVVGGKDGLPLILGNN